MNETEPDVNNTRRECVDFHYLDNHDIERRAKLCCCTGSDYCNEQIDWSDSARSLIQAELVTNGGSNLSVTTTSLFLTNPWFIFVFMLALLASSSN